MHADSSINAKKTEHCLEYRDNDNAAADAKQACEHARRTACRQHGDSEYD
jgi:hypothetical protein